jgi:hypothetical protein
VVILLTNRLKRFIEKGEINYSELTLQESIWLTEFLDIYFDADKKKVIFKEIDY